jgi:glycosyltransferase involved in cell wall biosynthesis
MLSGSGIQNKILQAMAHGCCVATTPIGEEGITAISDGYILCSPNPPEMAKEIQKILMDHRLRQQIGNTAATLVATHFNKDAIRKEFNKFICND